ncbi:MAG: hypothetical protein JWQ35_2646, partial [Bacteriovoracaceae bacterium]|nr:hypothetical protein [Bacteriovoracaceae bacterium]
PVMIAFITDWDTRLREAYVKEMRDQFRLSDEAEKALAKEQLAEDEAYFVFIASIATREPSWNDLNQKRSMWRTTLENKDSTIQVDPERIELIPQKDESAKYYYRKMDTFNQTYKIRFPRAALKDAQDVYFHISGPRGGITVRFPNPAPKRSIDDAPDAR